MWGLIGRWTGNRDIASAKDKRYAIKRRSDDVIAISHRGIRSGECIGKRNSGMRTLRFAIAKSHRRILSGKQNRGGEHCDLRFAISHRRSFKWCGIGSEGGKWSDIGSKEGSY